MQNFTAADLIATVLAFAAFIPMLFVPGYISGWLLNLFEFRQRTQIARITIAIPLSIGVAPILTYLLWRWSLRGVVLFYGAGLILFLALAVRERKQWFSGVSLTRTQLWILAIAAGWLVLASICLVDLQIGDRLYFPTAAYDFTLRAAITSAITRTGVPPVNPYFFPGQPYVLRYHYFWLLPCSLVEQLGGNAISPRQAMIASNLWAGLALFSTVALWLRFFQPAGAKNLDRRILTGLVLLGVTGLDVVPVLLLDLFTPRIFETVEWWNNPQVSAWLTTMLWVPHNVAALVACLTGFVLIWDMRACNDKRRTVASSVAAGLAFASAAGLSIYVTLTFGCFMAIWLAIAAFTNQRRNAALICGAGVISLLLALPYLQELRGGPASSGGGSEGPVLQLTFRAFPIAEATVASKAGDDWRVLTADALCLPLNYFLELGFFAVVGVVKLRQMRRAGASGEAADLCAFWMAATSVVICTFVRSSTIANNDLGRRGFLPAQFILLIWGAELWDGRFRARMPAAGWMDRHHVLINSLLILGFAGSLYEAAMVRFYPILSDISGIRRSRWLSEDHELGRRTFALRTVYEELKHDLPEGAIVQHNPNGNPGDIPFGLYADRQAVAETPQCGVVFGGDAGRCAAIVPAVESIFNGMGDADAVCRSLSIDALVVKNTDPVWAQKSSWVWQRKPRYESGLARAFLCPGAPRRIDPGGR